jgi:hypothetical protein
MPKAHDSELPVHLWEAGLEPNRLSKDDKYSLLAAIFMFYGRRFLPTGGVFLFAGTMVRIRTDRDIDEAWRLLAGYRPPRGADFGSYLGPTYASPGENPHVQMMRSALKMALKVGGDVTVARARRALQKFGAAE